MRYFLLLLLFVSFGLSAGELPYAQRKAAFDNCVEWQNDAMDIKTSQETGKSIKEVRKAYLPFFKEKGTKRAYDYINTIIDLAYGQLAKSNRYIFSFGVFMQCMKTFKVDPTEFLLKNGKWA